MDPQETKNHQPEKRKRYYVVDSDGERGPFKAKEIREELRAGTLANHALIRREGEKRTKPASAMFPEELNPYAPPRTTSQKDSGKKTGDFGTGVVIGFFGGCIALIYARLSRSIGSETKRGIYTGFFIAIGLGLLSGLLSK
jgi:hypothetical protein